MTYRTVYDVTKLWFWHWEPLIIGLLFVWIGSLLVYPAVTMPPGLKKNLQEKGGRVLSWSFILSACAFMLVPLSQIRAYQDASNGIKEGRYSIIEGNVTQFIPMPWAGHALECFVVSGERYCYADYIVGVGFNNTASHGGPIKDGLPVRITYNARNAILRLEIAKR